MLGCSLLLLPTILLAPYYHGWCLKMRERDDRLRIRPHP
jgi:hypothetical protein